jgi:long-subunit fatty acid transport protein
VLILLIASAHAGSLDAIEVGGAFGTPLADNPTALWWNPAGLAHGRGTRTLIEAAPTIASVDFERDDPYNGGSDTYRLFGVVPFAGIASDFGNENLGVGMALAVPYARGGAADGQPGAGSFAMRDGSVQAAFLMAGGGYRIPNTPVSLGANASIVQSSWSAIVDSELTTSLDAEIAEKGLESGYTDAQIESADYATTLRFSPLTATQITFGAGLRLDFERVAVGLAYQHSARVDNRGDVTMDFGCPPQDDAIGRFGAEQFGLCNTEIDASAAVAYTLPARFQGGVQVEPIDGLYVEGMGAYVRWSQYTDFDIRVSDVQTDNEEAAELLAQERLWARDNVDSWWAGLDVKGDVNEQLTLGGRVLYDRAAVPSHAMGPNNYDANVAWLGALAAYEPVPWLQLGLQYSHALAQTRTVEDSAFLVTLDEAKRPEDRWFYPQMNGTYGASISRIGLSAQAKFGHRD